MDQRHLSWPRRVSSAYGAKNASVSTDLKMVHRSVDRAHQRYHLGPPALPRKHQTRLRMPDIPIQIPNTATESRQAHLSGEKSLHRNLQPGRLCSETVSELARKEQRRHWTLVHPLSSDQTVGRVQLLGCWPRKVRRGSVQYSFVQINAEEP